MYCADVYGLVVSASQEFPTAILKDVEADVQLHLQSSCGREFSTTQIVSGTDPERSITKSASAGGWTRVLFPEEIYFEISPDGSEIHTGWSESFAIEDMFTYLVGPIIPLVLSGRGMMALHACTLRTPNGEGVAVAGGNAAGKSTLAATSMALGWDVVADDLAIFHPDMQRVLKGPRQVRVWPENAKALGHPNAPDLTPNWPKKYLTPPDTKPLAAVNAVFVMSSSEELKVRRLEGAEALVRTAAMSYLRKYQTRPQIQHELDQWAMLVENTPIFELHRTDDWSERPEICELILSTLRTL